LRKLKEGIVTSVSLLKGTCKELKRLQDLHEETPKIEMEKENEKTISEDI
jgi:hypothetical protein